MTISKESRQVILDMKIARIIKAYCERYHVSLEEAIDTYYGSVTAQMVEEGIADLHCRSDKYLADELWLEVQKNKQAEKKVGLTVNKGMQKGCD